MPVTINRNKVLYSSLAYRTQFYPGAPGTFFPTLTLNRASTDRIVRGDNIKDWREKIRRKESATTTLEVTVENLDLDRHAPGYYRSETHDRTTGKLTSSIDTRGHIGTYTVPPVITMSLTEADNKALAKFIEDATEAQTSFQGGVWLGELKETLQFIRRPGTGIRKAYREYLTTVKDVSRKASRKPRASRLRITEDAIASSHLEVQFAVKPLVADINNAFEALTNLQLRRPTAVVRGRGIVSRLQPKITDVRSFGPHTITRTYITREESSVKYYGCVELESGNAGLRQHFGVLPQDFIPTIYELIPYSWMVDYFSNLNEIVRAACFNKASIKWMNRSTRRAATRALHSCSFDVYDGRGTSSVHSRAAAVPPGKFELSTLMLTRSPYTGSLIPSLEFELPGFRQSLNVAGVLALGRSTEQYVRR